MFVLFGIAILVIVALVFFMFFILKGTVKKINTQTKLYFVDKLQEYDYLINQKEEKLNQINQEIRDRELKNADNEVSSKKKNYEFDYQIIDLLNKTQYQDKNIFELNKKIDEADDMLMSKEIDKDTHKRIVSRHSQCISELMDKQKFLKDSHGLCGKDRE